VWPCQQLEPAAGLSTQPAQQLQPLLQSHLTHLTLQGFNLSQSDCHLRHLVALLLQHCPLLEHLDMQV